MTRSMRGSRRLGAVIAVAAATLLVSGCGAGQIAETALKEPSVPGANQDLRTADGSYKIRNLVLDYPGVEGYQAGDDVTIEVAIFNDTNAAATVTLTSDDARAVQLTSASPSPTEPTSSPEDTERPQSEPTEQAPEGEPARVEIPAGGFVVFSTSSPQRLQLVGLNQALRAGQSVTLTFDFGNGQQLTTEAPVQMPLTPVPPAPPVVEGHRQ